MNSSNRTADYIGHMLDAIDRAMAYVAPFPTAEAFARNEQAVDAVIRTIEILGEAADRIARRPRFSGNSP